MMKAVNMKNYQFRKNSAVYYFSKGFGMLDTETNEFVAMNGIPYVLDTKKIVDGCIAAGYQNSIKDRVKALAK